MKQLPSVFGLDMSKNTFRTPGASIKLAENLIPADTTILKDMQLLKTGKFYDPRYKWFEVTSTILSEMISNFKAGVRGIIPALDYMHESDGAAAGWIKDLYMKNDSGVTELWGKVELTPRAQKVLSDKEFGYISADFDENYLDNETGKKHGAVLLGAALTNRPVIKKMDAVIQLSEQGDKMNEEQKKQMADLQAKCAEGDKKLADLKQIMDDNGIANMEQLMKMIADMKAKEATAPQADPKVPNLADPAPAAPADDSKAELEIELSDAKKKLSESIATIESLNKKASLAEKELEFAKLLSEGKAVASQRESFLEGDMKKFIELTQPIKLSEHGSGGTPKPKFDSDDVEAEIEKEAKKLSEEKKISFGAAVSEVLSTNKTLAEKRKKKFESDSE